MNKIKRPATQKELALMFFPDLSPQAARRNLTMMIRNNPRLVEELEKTGYNSRDRYITPRQYELIITAFGQPGQ